MEDTGKRKKVLCPIERNGRTEWKLLGNAFVNKDASINVFLDGLPVNGRLHLRDWDEPPRERRVDNGQQPQQFTLRSVAGEPAMPQPARPTDDLPF